VKNSKIFYDLAIYKEQKYNLKIKIFVKKKLEKQEGKKITIRRKIFLKRTKLQRRNKIITKN
jgi:hypothetical protein